MRCAEALCCPAECIALHPVEPCLPSYPPPCDAAEPCPTQLCGASLYGRLAATLEPVHAPAATATHRRIACAVVP